MPVKRAYDSTGLRAIWRIRQYMRQHRIAALVTYHFMADCVGTAAAWGLSRLAVISSRRDVGFTRNKRKLQIGAFLDRRVDHYIAVSDAVRQAVSRDERVDPRKISAIFNGCDIQELDRYRSAVLDVEKKARLVEKSSASYYPQVVFNGFYGQNFGPNDSSNLNEGDWNNKETWQAVVNLKWTVFDFGNRKTSKQMAVIRKQQSRRDRLTTELELKRSLSEAVTKIELAIDDFHSAETELALTRDTESIEQTRFEKGAADLNDLLYAKARNQLALSRSITARYSYQNCRFYLDYLLENGENK